MDNEVARDVVTSSPSTGIPPCPGGEASFKARNHVKSPWRPLCRSCARSDGAARFFGALVEMAPGEALAWEVMGQ